MKMTQDRVPGTIRQAVQMLRTALEPDEERLISQTGQSYKIHHGFGTAIRNGWSLWEPDSPLKRDAVETYGIAHADDISGLILEWLWSDVWEIEFDPIEFVKRYHRHWEQAGTTALAAGGWPPDDEE